MKFILIIWVATFDTRGGVGVTAAEFNNENACLIAAERVKKEFDTLFTQTPKIICVEKGNGQ